MTPGRRLRRIAAASGTALALASAAAVPCGLEDPSSISFRRGVMNLAYPESLHVGTAVWQAQAAGALPADPISQREDLGPDARAKMRSIMANGLLQRLAGRLGEAKDDLARPPLAVVLLGPVMWSRVERRDGAVRAQVHVEGPETGDVVVVTEMATIQAIVNGDVGFDEALRNGYMRLYGPPGDVAATRTWLSLAPRS